MPRRILFVVGTLALGGIERLVADLSLALRRTGEWEPVVCCLIAKKGPFVERLEKQGVAIYECPLTSKNLVSFPRRFAGLIKHIAPDLVHSHVDYSIPWQVLGARLAGVTAIVFTQHNQYPYWEAHFWARARLLAYYRISRRFISAYTAVSQKVQKHVAGLVLRPESDFQVIYNPVDVHAFKPNPQAGKRARAEMNIKNGEFVVGNVGRLIEQKGHVYLLQAAEMIQQSDPEVHFVIIGDGPLHEQLQSQSRAARLDANVAFLGGRPNVNQFLPGFDCFCLPSLWEGGPIVVLEAMACGLPVVSTDVGMAAEALSGGCGLIVPPADPKALAQAILQIKLEPELAGLFAQKARARAVETFRLEVVAQAYADLYESALG